MPAHRPPLSIPHAECRFPLRGRQFCGPDIRDVKAGDRPHRPEELVDGVLSALNLNGDRPIGSVSRPACQAPLSGQYLCLPSEPDALDKPRKVVMLLDERRLRAFGSMRGARLCVSVFQPLKQVHLPLLLVKIPPALPSFSACQSTLSNECSFRRHKRSSCPPQRHSPSPR